MTKLTPEYQGFSPLSSQDALKMFSNTVSRNEGTTSVFKDVKITFDVWPIAKGVQNLTPTPVWSFGYALEMWLLCARRDGWEM